MRTHMRNRPLLCGLFSHMRSYFQRISISYIFVETLIDIQWYILSLLDTYIDLFFYNNVNVFVWIEIPIGQNQENNEFITTGCWENIARWEDLEIFPGLKVFYKSAANYLTFSGFFEPKKVVIGLFVKILQLSLHNYSSLATLWWPKQRCRSHCMVNCACAWLRNFVYMCTARAWLQY